MDFYKSQCCQSYYFHFTFAIITVSSLCAHNHMNFEISSQEKHEHPPVMPLFAKVTGFCTSTFLTHSKVKLKKTLEEVIKICKEVYLLQMSLQSRGRMIPLSHRFEVDVFFFAMHWMHLVILHAGGTFKWSVLEGMQGPHIWLLLVVVPKSINHSQ